MSTDGRILALDIGSGTQDLLLYEPDRPIETCVQMVLPAPTVVAARRIRRATSAGDPVFLTGVIMGGGAVTTAAREHVAAGHACYATEQAARTFHDNLDRVREWGIAITASPPRTCQVIQTRDVDVSAIARALELYEVEIPARWAVAVQDHGDCPHGSNRLTRNAVLREHLETGGDLFGLAYREPPAVYTRMRAVQATVPGALVMDTGAAAVLGALLDAEAAARESPGLTVVNVGNEHTLAALVADGRLWGLMEHHTFAMQEGSLPAYLSEFRSGRLTERAVFDDGGHGCHVVAGRPSADFDWTVVTGPQRRRAAGAGHHAAPYGNMMLTGCYGLVRAALHDGGHPHALRPDR